MGESDSKEWQDMKCSFKDCKGELEMRLVVHAIKHNGNIVVIENVPAEVCKV